MSVYLKARTAHETVMDLVTRPRAPNIPVKLSGMLKEQLLGIVESFFESQSGRIAAHRNKYFNKIDTGLLLGKI